MLHILQSSAEDLNHEFELLQDEMGLDLELLQKEVLRQQGNVKKACQLLQGHASDSSISPAEGQRTSSAGDDILDWGKREETEADSLFGSMQSEFTNLELDHGSGKISSYALGTILSTEASIQSNSALVRKLVKKRGLD